MDNETTTGNSRYGSVAGTMRLRICSKIPPFMLAGLIIFLVIINKKTTIEKEEMAAFEKMEAQAHAQNTNEFEKPKDVQQEEETPENSLKKIQENYQQHMKTLQEKEDMEAEINARKDLPVDNVQDVPDNKDDVVEIKEEPVEQNKEVIAPIKETVEQIKAPVAQEKPSLPANEIKPELKPDDVKAVNEQAAVKPVGIENIVVKDVYSQMAEYKKAIDNDVELQESKKTFSGIVTLAQNVLSAAPSPKILLLSFVHEDNAVFANNWLCNTQVLSIHSSLIIVTYGSQSKEFLSKKWPTLNLYPIEPNTPEENLREDPLTLKKLQVIYVLLNAGINVLLLDVESVWLSNPVPSFKTGGTDMMVNIASSVQVNTGFIVLFATEKNKHFWGSLYLKVKQYKNAADVELEGEFDRLLKMMTVQR